MSPQAPPLTRSQSLRTGRPAAALHLVGPQIQSTHVGGESALSNRLPEACYSRPSIRVGFLNVMQELEIEVIADLVICYGFKNPCFAAAVESNRQDPYAA